MSSAKFQPPKGTRDFYPADMAVRRHIERAWRDASIAFGYDEIDGPTFEHLELYTAKSGPGIVSELFSFRRQGGESDYALRPEFTPTLARMAAARMAQLPQPVKWFALPSFFRAERPQRGRLREFQQWNVDLLGASGPAVDAEVIAVAVNALQRLGLTPKDVRVKVNHREVLARFVSACASRPVDLAKVFELLDRSAKLTRDEVQAEIVRLDLSHFNWAKFVEGIKTVIPCSEQEPVIVGSNSVWTALQDEERALFTDLRQAILSIGLADWCDFDLGVVRGLAYYTGAVFEVHEAHGRERAIAGGGRYDGLIELFGGPPTPAIGFGMGDVVLGLVLADKGLLPKDGHELLPRPDAFVISTGDEAAERELPRMVSALRAAGLHVRHSYKSTRNLGKMLGDASKQRARFAVILGSETAGGHAMLKDLASGSQVQVELSAVAAQVREGRPGG